MTMARSDRPHSLLIVVIGVGRLGRGLAGRLSTAGHSVIAVDHDRERLERLPAEFSGFTIAGDAREVSVLRAARVGEADAVFTATRDDNLNLMLALMARDWFGARDVRARVGDSGREPIARALGVEIFNPNGLAAEACIEHIARRASA